MINKRWALQWRAIGNLARNANVAGIIRCTDDAAYPQQTYEHVHVFVQVVVNNQTVRHADTVRLHISAR
jgi:hypothetical protein